MNVHAAHDGQTLSSLLYKYPFRTRLNLFLVNFTEIIKSLPTVLPCCTRGVCRQGKSDCGKRVVWPGGTADDVLAMGWPQAR